MKEMKGQKILEEVEKKKWEKNILWMATQERLTKYRNDDEGENDVYIY